MTVANAKPDLLITGPLGTSMVNGASSAWSAFTGVEAKLTAAIAYAVSVGAKYCYVPDCFLPYTASQVTFNSAVKMVREGSDPRIADLRAYGAFGDGATDDTAALVATKNGAGNGGSAYVPNGTYVVAGFVTFDVPNQEWTFDASAKLLLKAASNTHLLFVNADNIAITGGVLDGNKANQSSGSGQCVLVRATNFLIQDVTVQNSFHDGIHIDAPSNIARILNCTVTGGRGNCVLVTDASNVSTLSCILDATAGVLTANSNPVQYASTVVGKSVTGGRILGNICTVAATNSAGVVYGANGGDTPSSGDITGNVITFAGACLGGISVATATHCTVTGNTVNAAGFSNTSAGIEMVQCTACAVTSNTLNGGTTLGQHGIILNGSSHNTVTGNTINGFTNGGTGRGITVRASSTLTARRNTITGNNIIFPATGVGYGIWISSDVASGDAGENILLGNYIEGNGVANTLGVRLERGTGGTIDRTIIAHNIFRSVDGGIEQATGAANITNSLIGPNHFLSITFGLYNGNAALGAGHRLVQSSRVSADRGDASVTLAVDVDEETQIFNTALTAPRTVTLPTANVINGARFRIVRTAAATGVSALTVQALLNGNKALAVGQEVEAHWNGANWVETMGSALL